eukprot:jgi/Psemu1/4668/gm1.4668_g
MLTPMEERNPDIQKGTYETQIYGRNPDPLKPCPPGISFDKKPPSTQPAAKKTPSGKPGNLLTKQTPKPTPKATPKATPSGKPLGFKDLIVLLNKRDPFPKHLKVAFFKDFTQKNILSLVENSVKSQLLKIFEDCYHSMGATVSSRKRNWGISCVAKQLGAIMLTFHEYKVLRKDLQSGNRKNKPLEMVAYLNGLEFRFTKELKKAKAKEIAAHDAKIGKLTMPLMKTGQRPQDFVKFDPKKILKQTSLQCGHFNTTEPQSVKEIEQINKQLEDEHQTEMIHWENKSTAVTLKTRKPCKKPTQERQIACYCHNIHCMLETNGGVCYYYCGYVKDGKDLPMDQTGKACKCEVCLCKCDLVFVKSKRLAIVSAIDPLKEPDEEKAVVGDASVCLSYAEGKNDSRVNEHQYLTNPFATKADHLQNAHATAFLDIISNSVLGRDRVKKTSQEVMGPLQTTSKAGKTIYQLRMRRGDGTMKKAPTETPMDTPLKIGSYHEPITIDGDTEDSKHQPRTLICHTPSRSQEPPKDETPAFVRSVCQLAFEKADFQMNSQNNQDILDFVGPKLTYKDDSEVAVNMKVRVLDHGESGKEVTESLSSVVKWCKGVQVHKQQKVQKEDD